MYSGLRECRCGAETRRLDQLVWCEQNYTDDQVVRVCDDTWYTWLIMVGITDVKLAICTGKEYHAIDDILCINIVEIL